MSDNRSIEFIQRHIGPSEDDQNKMLSYLGHSSMEEFINKIVPQKIIETKNLKLDSSVSENDALTKLKSIAKQNKIFKSYIGICLLYTSPSPRD